MAKSGTTTVKVTNWDSLRFTWQQVSQDIEYNTTTISWKLELVSGAYGKLSSTAAKAWSVTIAGAVYSGTNSIGIENNTTKTLASNTTEIIHNNDGSKTVSYSFSQEFNVTFSGNKIGVFSGSGTAELEDIPRAAYIDIAPNFDDESNPTIYYDNPAGDAVAGLEACISLDGSADDIAYRSISKTGLSYTFNLTAAERKILRAATISNGNSRNVRFYIRTTIGDTKYLKYVTKTFTVINCKPTLNPVVTDIDTQMIALTGNNKKFVKYYSNPSYTMNAAALKEASITKLQAICGDVIRSTQNGEFYNIENNTIKFSVTDNRGNTTSKTVTLDMVDYVKLTCNLAAAAPTPLGDASITISGNCFNGSFGATTNTLAVKYRYKANNENYGEWITATATRSGNKYTSNVVISGLDYQKSYTIQARAEDKITYIESAEKKVKTTPVFDWSDEDFNINVNLKLKNKTVLRNNGENNNIVLSAEGATNGVFIRPNGTGSSEGQSIFDTEGNLSLSGGLTATNVNGFEIGANKDLWQGTNLMGDSQSITLNEGIDKQTHGIVLIFSRYSNGSAESANFNYFFIPKGFVAAAPGVGSCFSMNTVNFGVCAAKYLYINNSTISGNSLNTSSGTGASGVKYDNSAYCLRAVVGV